MLDKHSYFMLQYTHVLQYTAAQTFDGIPQPRALYHQFFEIRNFNYIRDLKILQHTNLKIDWRI